MKMPKDPPSYWPIIMHLMKSDRFSGAARQIGSSDAGYLHWDKLRHLTPPDGLESEEWWAVLKFNRSRKPIPLEDMKGESFTYGLPDPIPERLHQIDMYAAGNIEVPQPIKNPETKDRYLINSLMAEAITSSQIEGAVTTRRVAKEMIRTGRLPRDRSEQMILNNFVTMRRITELKDKPLSKELLLELHEKVTRGTLDNPLAAGRFRLPDERIDLGSDFDDTVFHTPPPANELEGRVEAMCDFANGKTPEEFVHPVIRSIILHFWLAYDHPFVDGNGRTARALFYWSMLQGDFWLCEFVSISELIHKAPVKYYRAFLHTETDGNDLTYFVLYHLEILRRAIEQLHEYIKRKSRELEALDRQVRGMADLNHRQRVLVAHALRHPHQRYTFESHRQSNGVAQQTARTDLLNLADRGLLAKNKVGKVWNFTPTPDMEARLKGQ